MNDQNEIYLAKLEEMWDSIQFSLKEKIESEEDSDRICILMFMEKRNKVEKEILAELNRSYIDIYVDIENLKRIDR